MSANQCQYIFPRGLKRGLRCDNTAIMGQYCDQCSESMNPRPNSRVIDWLESGVVLTVLKCNVNVNGKVKTLYREPESNYIIKFDERDRPYAVGIIDENNNLMDLTPEDVEICEEEWDLEVSKEELVHNDDDNCINTDGTSSATTGKSSIDIPSIPKTLPTAPIDPITGNPRMHVKPLLNDLYLEVNYDLVIKMDRTTRNIVCVGAYKMQTGEIRSLTEEEIRVCDKYGLKFDDTGIHKN